MCLFVYIRWKPPWSVYTRDVRYSFQRSYTCRHAYNLPDSGCSYVSKEDVRDMTEYAYEASHVKSTRFKPHFFFIQVSLKKITVVVITNSDCKSVTISGTIFYRWDYYNYIIKSTIILYYIFLVDLTIKNSCPFRGI